MLRQITHAHRIFQPRALHRMASGQEQASDRYAGSAVPTSPAKAPPGQPRTARKTPGAAPPPPLSFALVSQLEQLVNSEAIQPGQARLLGTLARSPHPTVRVMALRMMEDLPRWGDPLTSHQQRFGAGGPSTLLSRKTHYLEGDRAKEEFDEVNWEAYLPSLEHILHSSPPTPEEMRAVTHLWSAMLMRPPKGPEEDRIRSSLESTVRGWVEGGQLESEIPLHQLKARATQQRLPLSQGKILNTAEVELQGAAAQLWKNPDQLGELEPEQRQSAVDGILNKIKKSGEFHSGPLLKLLEGVTDSPEHKKYLRPHLDFLASVQRRAVDLGWETCHQEEGQTLGHLGAKFVELFPERVDREYLEQEWAPQLLTTRHYAPYSTHHFTRAIVEHHPEFQDTMINLFMDGYRESYLDQRATNFLGPMLEGGWKPLPQQAQWLAGWCLPDYNQTHFVGRSQQLGFITAVFDELEAHDPEIRSRAWWPDRNGKATDLSRAVLSRMLAAKDDNEVMQLSGEGDWLTKAVRPEDVEPLKLPLVPLDQQSPEQLASLVLAEKLGQEETVYKGLLDQLETQGSRYVTRRIIDRARLRFVEEGRQDLEHADLRKLLRVHHLSTSKQPKMNLRGSVLGAGHVRNRKYCDPITEELVAGYLQPLNAEQKAALLTQVEGPLPAPDAYTPDRVVDLLLWQGLARELPEAAVSLAEASEAHLNVPWKEFPQVTRRFWQEEAQPLWLEHRDHDSKLEFGSRMLAAVNQKSLGDFEEQDAQGLLLAHQVAPGTQLTKELRSFWKSKILELRDLPREAEDLKDLPLVLEVREEEFAHQKARMADPGVALEDRVKAFAEALHLVAPKDRAEFWKSGTQRLLQSTLDDPRFAPLGFTEETSPPQAYFMLEKLAQAEGQLEENIADMANIRELSAFDQEDAFRMFDELKAMKAEGLDSGTAWERLLRKEIGDLDEETLDIEVEYGENHLKVGGFSLDVL